MTRKLSLVLGIVLAVGAFVGVLLIGSMANPSPYHVVVAIKEIQPGEVLAPDLVGVDPQVVSPQVAEEYVLDGELDQYLGSTVVRNLVPGQPLMHRDLVDAENPAASTHLALALENPNLVAMVIPVEEDNTPDGIVPGDQIAIAWSVGEGNFMNALMGESSPFNTSGTSGTPAEGGAGLSEGVDGSQPPPEVAALIGEAEAEPTPEVSLPLAKTIINTAQVIRVRREQEANPAYTGQEDEQPYIEGDVTGLEVVVPQEEMEVVQFAVANGEYSIVVLSPNADPEALAEATSLGVMWTDVLAYFQADRLRALGVLTITEPVRPSGASNLYGPILAPGSSSASGPRRDASPETETTPSASPGDDVPPEETPETEEESTEEVGAVTPTPAPLPTATSVVTATQASEASAGSEGEGIGAVPTRILLLGGGCSFIALALILAAVGLVIRKVRSRATQGT